MNLVQLLEDSAKKFSWRKCLISEGGTLSFRGLNKKSSRFAANLSNKLGVSKTDKIAILMNNQPEFIISLFAIFKTTAACVPLNAFLTLNEIKYILGDSRVKVLITSSDFMPLLEKMVKHKGKGDPQLAHLKEIIIIDKKEEGFTYGPDFFKFSFKPKVSKEINSHDLALLIYTSGTTGFPKGVMLTHANLYANVLSSVCALQIKSSDRFLLVLPMFHSFTMMVCIFIPIYTGAKIIILKSLRPFQRVLRSILINRITIISAIPPIYDILKNLKVPYLVRMFLRVRVCISGAAPLSVGTLTQFKRNFKHIVLLEGYGLTEASPVVSLNPLNGEQRPASIGLPVPQVQVKVVAEDESELPFGEVGELIVKGPNVMKGYYNLPDETKKAIRGGWLFTGDMAKIDEQGYIYIVGRKKEMILIHGMNVYPLEIENALLDHPQIKEAAVVGKKDKLKNEVPVAFVVLTPDANLSQHDVIAYCKDRLAAYKIPRIIKFKQQLPKTPTGKVLKRQLI